jgi:hypothetical protein
MRWSTAKLNIAFTASRSPLVGGRRPVACVRVGDAVDAALGVVGGVALGALGVADLRRLLQRPDLPCVRAMYCSRSWGTVMAPPLVREPSLSSACQQSQHASR